MDERICDNCLYFEHHRDSENGKVFYECWNRNEGVYISGAHPTFSCSRWKEDRRPGWQQYQNERRLLREQVIGERDD